MSISQIRSNNEIIHLLTRAEALIRYDFQIRIRQLNYSARNLQKLCRFRDSLEYRVARRIVSFRSTNMLFSICIVEDGEKTERGGKEKFDSSGKLGTCKRDVEINVATKRTCE